MRLRSSIASQVVSAGMLSAVVAASALAAASASATTKRLEQCAGANIRMDGSTFQNVAQFQWETRSANPLSFNDTTDALGCSGTQGSKGKPEVEYEQTTETRGENACLHTFGVNTRYPSTQIWPICGTDEAPTPTEKEEIEAHREGTPTGESLETIPVTQGSVGILIHLPEGCKASSEVEEKGVKHLLGRLVLDQTSIEKVYTGEIKNWEELIDSVSAGNDQLEGCTGGAAAEKDRIRPVVRKDRSGVTHIFKAFLQQVDASHSFEMERFPEEVGGENTGCGGLRDEEYETWAEVAEGCQNQRWPREAEVLRPTWYGDLGVIDEVSATPSSLGYANIAAAREDEFFSKKDYSRYNFQTETIETGSGGENKRGTATKRGEQNPKFWAELQNLKEYGAYPDAEFADPTSTFDTEKLGSANCKGTHYVEEFEGHPREFPPASTLSSWSTAKAYPVEEYYSICGITYDLAFKQYEPYLSYLGIGEAEGEAKVTTAENYLLYEVNAGAGGNALKNHDYEVLPASVVKIAEKGIKEIEW